MTATQRVRMSPILGARDVLFRGVFGTPLS